MVVRLADFEVVCDARVNTPAILDRDHFKIEVKTPRNIVLDITIDKDGNPVAFNGMPIKHLILGQ